MKMEFALKNTHAKGSEVSPFLEEKTGKLKKYFNGKLHARWTIAYEQDEHEAHLHATGNNFDFMGKSRDHNLYTAIEQAVEKVERQLLKHKEIIQDHHSK
jgi:putative sigma-54 modulation protein